MWIEPDRLVVVLYSEVMFALGLVGESPVIEGFVKVRFKFNGLVIVLNRTVVTTFIVEGDSTVVERAGVIRFKLNRFVVVLAGPLVLTLKVIRIPPTIKSLRKFRLEFDGLIVIRDGGIILVLSLIRLAAFVECNSQVVGDFLLRLNDCGASHDSSVWILTRTALPVLCPALRHRAACQRHADESYESNRLSPHKGTLA